MKKQTLVKRGVLIGAVAMLSLLSVWGCGKEENEGEEPGTETKEVLEEKETGEAAVSEEEKTAEEETEDTQTEEDSGADQAALEELQAAKIRHYYEGVLSELTCALTLPDMEMEDPYEMDLSMSDNSYAIYDVDGDGKEELIINYSTASMVGMSEIVYGYNPETDELKQEMLGFPGLMYYDNGIIQANSSHNHSRGMDFWPFALYRYQEESDTYAQIGYVDTWSKEVADTYSEGEAFPDELDKDGDGILYNISEGANPTFEYADYKYDKADYDAWISEKIGDAKALEPEYLPIDYENFGGYTQEYFDLLKKVNADKLPEGVTDLGLLFFEENYSMDELEQFLSDQYGVTLESDYEEEQNGLYDGEKVFCFYQMDAGGFSYSGKQVGDLTIFGIYPGMEESQALEYLKAYGFYQQGETETSFVTGDGLDNRSVWYEAEDGKIVSVSTHYYCAFAG